MGASSGARKTEEGIALQEIGELTSAYCRGVDRHDETLLRSIFHDDSVVVGGMFNGSGQEFATVICRIMTAVFQQTHHAVTDQRIELDGDQAFAETHMVTVATMAADDGAPSEILSGGVCADRFERRDGTWKFSSRHFICDFAVERPASGEAGQQSPRPQLN